MPAVCVLNFIRRKFMAHADLTRFNDGILISNHCLNPLLIDCKDVWQSMQAISDCLKCFNGILNLFTFKPFLLFLFFQVKIDDVFKFFVSLFWCYLFGIISSNSFLLLSVESSFLISGQNEVLILSYQNCR